MAEVQVLNRETAIPELTAPTGRKFGVKQYEPNPGLYEIYYADKKPGELPVIFQNHRFTKRDTAIAYVTKYLNEFWDTSDSKKK
jgi:hypothetical protein